MKLIPNWKRAHRMLTVQMASVFVVWGTLPEDTQAAILDLVGIPANRVPAILGLLVLAGRLIAQPKVSGQ